MFETNNETMSLGNISTSFKKGEIVINTDRFANEGRFVAGVCQLNNKNCEFIVYDIDTIPRCFVKATKTINMF